MALGQPKPRPQGKRQDWTASLNGSINTAGDKLGFRPLTFVMETLTLRPVPNLGKPPDQYLIDLLDGSYAVLTRIDQVWSVTEHKKSHRLIDRGLFGTPEDALEVFRAEVTARMSVEHKDTA